MDPLGGDDNITTQHYIYAMQYGKQNCKVRGSRK